MDEHAHGDARHVEAVEEVLDCHVRLVVHLVRLLQLQHSLWQDDESEILFSVCINTKLPEPLSVPHWCA